MRLFIAYYVFIAFIFIVSLYYSYKKDQNIAVAKQKNVLMNVTYPTPINLSSNLMWVIIQEWRVQNGLNTYIKDKQLCDIADDRVNDDKLDNHKGFIEKYHYGPYEISENLGTDYSEEKMLKGWLESKPHAEALKKPYKASCVRCLDNYCVHIMSSLNY